jgi:hypothetical protein
MKQILKNIFIYMSLVLCPPALISMARNFHAASEQIEKNINETMRLNKELADALARGSFEKLIAASRGHDGGAA